MVKNTLLLGKNALKVIYSKEIRSFLIYEDVNNVLRVSSIIIFLLLIALVSEAWREELKDLATKVSLSPAGASKKKEEVRT